MLQQARAQLPQRVRARRLAPEQQLELVLEQQRAPAQGAGAGV
jgi:hypothetical protein